MSSKDLSNPNYYINRELSWLDFNDRVLEEAQDKTNLLMERLKFLAITASNLDEFFMVRVSYIYEQKESGIFFKDPAGKSILEQHKEISKKVREMFNKQYTCFNRSIVPLLEKENIKFLKYGDLSTSQREYVQRYFVSTVYPILTPMAIDNSRPLPLLNNKSINLIIELENEKNPDADHDYAIMQIPTVIQRIISLPTDSGERGRLGADEARERYEFIFLEEIIANNIDLLFTGHKVLNTSLFRITRNSDLSIDEEDSLDLRDEIEKSVKKRRWGNLVRLEVEKGMIPSSRKYLQQWLMLENLAIYEINGPLDLTVFMGFSLRDSFERLRNRQLAPVPCVDFLNRPDIFEVIREKDVLVHHPYDAFDCVIDFVTQAANDPNVLAIKQTLYRVSGNSPIVSALMQAAENGKQVTVLVELRARFDEENNILWAKRLEKSGCHVVYGLAGLKTHCKICLVVRKEDDGIRRYIHLSTGNYNDSTAKIYTDMGYFTSKETFGQDASSLFNVLTGYSAYTGWNKLAVAPVNLRDTFIHYIDNEAANAADGKDACIIAKLNSLVDPKTIEALYRASIKGVKIKLIVRGICCLRAGIEGVSENITVVSIVDRFLEHSRIYYFENNGNAKIFLSSADWMPRNLDKRVEVAFPIEDADLKEKLVEVLDLTLSDTIKQRVMQPDGSYERIDRRGKEHVQSQLVFHRMAEAALADAIAKQRENVFTVNTRS